MSEIEEDPCRTCLLQTACREFCEEGSKYHKKKMFSEISGKKLLLFKLDLLLLRSDETAGSFLRRYPEVLDFVDGIRNGNELYEILNKEHKKRRRSKNKTKETKSLLNIKGVLDRKLKKISSKLKRLTGGKKE